MHLAGFHRVHHLPLPDTGSDWTVLPQLFGEYQCPERGNRMDLHHYFWNWSGRYVGYCLSDRLFGCDGRQVGYFAEGEEVYGCHGDYLGEIRSGDRLITNRRKKTWTRESSIPQFLKSSPGQRNVSAKEMLVGHEDFPVWRERIRSI